MFCEGEEFQKNAGFCILVEGCEKGSAKQSKLRNAALLGALGNFSRDKTQCTWLRTRTKVAILEGNEWKNDLIKNTANCLNIE